MPGGQGVGVNGVALCVSAASLYREAARRCTPSLRPNISSTLACLPQDDSICMYTISRFLNGIGSGNTFSWGWKKKSSKTVQ